jgi:hypothetical protein
MELREWLKTMKGDCPIWRLQLSGDKLGDRKKQGPGQAYTPCTKYRGLGLWKGR